ncbi:hypothetical protein C0036_15745 [Streptomyces sp. DJ]|nr:hypothetical protein C0036_15745 [Streptomyces sp. DJ]
MPEVPAGPITAAGGPDGSCRSLAGWGRHPAGFTRTRCLSSSDGWPASPAPGSSSQDSVLFQVLDREVGAELLGNGSAGPMRGSVAVDLLKADDPCTGGWAEL